MTKLREPISMENALYTVLGLITIERAAAVTGREPHYLRAAADPDKDQQLTVRDLELLDLEAHAQHGRGFPLYEALGRRLDCARAERFVDEAAIGRATMEHAREAGEATAALVAATLPTNNSVETLTTALRELEQSDAATGNAIAIVRQALARARDPTLDST
jgi:hypothetical protein